MSNRKRNVFVIAVNINQSFPKNVSKNKTIQIHKTFRFDLTSDQR